MKGEQRVRTLTQIPSIVMIIVEMPHTHTRRQTFSLSQKQTHSHTLSLSYTQTQTLHNTHIHTHTHAPSLSHTHTLSLSLSHTQCMDFSPGSWCSHRRRRLAAACTNGPIGSFSSMRGSTPFSISKERFRLLCTSG